MYFIVVFGGLVSLLFSFLNLPTSVLDWQLVILSFITIFGSSKLHFQLPKTKIHFSIADVLILYAALRYGGEIAVLLAFSESIFTSYSFKKKGITIKFKTFILNATLHSLSILITAKTIYFLFNPVDIINSTSNYDSIIILMLVMSVTQFFTNTILAAVFAAERLGKSFWSVWNESFINLGLLYIAESIIACLLYKIAHNLNFLLILVVTGLSVIIYVTYRRYVDEIRETAALAEKAERERAESEKLRAEQAEMHIGELQVMLHEQERISHELLESKNRFRHAAYHDNLTGLPNRNSVTEKIVSLLADFHDNQNNCFALFYIDLNSFKNINESLGYSIGNKILKLIAKRLSKITEKNDLVVRFSSDEFGLVKSFNDPDYNVLETSNQIINALSSPFMIEGRKVFVSPKIGISVAKVEDDSSEHIIRDAEIAMYQAKEKNSSAMIFDCSMHDLMIERIEIETDLRTAIKNKEFVLYFQPIINLQSTQISGFEALVRWNHPKKGLILPYKFIPVAEKTALIIPMTEWILEEACKQVKQWQIKYAKDYTISINISGRHFSHSNLVGLVSKVINDTSFNPSLLKLEITESAVMEDAEKAITILDELKALGVKLMIDDFGTGYSSLNYLHRFPVDTLKIDRSFVNLIGNIGEKNEIVNTIILMAKNMKMDVVAEGVETVQQLTLLRKLFCEFAQGYLFSKPLPNEQIETLLQENTMWNEKTIPLELTTMSEQIEISITQ